LLFLHSTKYETINRCRRSKTFWLAGGIELLNPNSSGSHRSSYADCASLRSLFPFFYGLPRRLPISWAPSL